MPRAARIESKVRQQLREPWVRSAPAIGRGEAAAIRGPLMGLGCNPSASALEHVVLASVVVSHLNDDEAVPVDRVDEATSSVIRRDLTVVPPAVSGSVVR